MQSLNVVEIGDWVVTGGTESSDSDGEDLISFSSFIVEAVVWEAWVKVVLLDVRIGLLNLVLLQDIFNTSEHLAVQVLSLTQSRVSASVEIIRSKGIQFLWGESCAVIGFLQLSGISSEILGQEWCLEQFNLSQLESTVSSGIIKIFLG